MSFGNSTNIKRVQKIVDVTELLAASASANEATQEEIWTMLTPALEALSELCGAPAEQPEEGSDQTSQSTPQEAVHTPAWVTIREMAEKASLPDLTYAMAVFMSRIDEHLNQGTKP